MLFKKGKKTKEDIQPQEKLPGKEQPSLYEHKPNEKDLVVPSVIKEVGPKESTSRGYHVEIGATNEAVRYYRSFFAQLTGATTYAGMLNQMYLGDFGDGDNDTVIHVWPADSTRTMYELSRRISGLESDLLREENNNKRASLIQAIQDLREQQNRLRKRLEQLFFVTIQVTASALSEKSLYQYCNALVKRFAGQQIHLRAADTRQLDAFLSATPLGKTGEFKGFARAMETSCVADLFPFGQGSISHTSGIVIGQDPYGRPVFFDGFHPDPKVLANYNIVVFGEAGHGKSFTVKKLALRSAVIGIRTAINDPGLEYKAVMKRMGCPYIELSPRSEDRINIFDVEEQEDSDGKVTLDLESSIKAAQAVVFKMIRSIDPNPEVLNGTVKIAIQEQIARLYEERGITNDPASLYETSRVMSDGRYTMQKIKKKMPVLSDLYELMQKDPRTQRVAEFIKAFTQYGSSLSQAIFDTETNVDIRNAPMFAFSLNDLDPDIMKPLGSFIVTKWLWERFAKKNPRQRKRIIIDEAQLLMQDEETAAWMENAWRQARKFNTSMCAVTQGFEVMARVPQGAGILKNSPTKILLRQHSRDIEIAKKEFDLSDGEAQFLLMTEPGHGIFKVDQESTQIYIDYFPEEYILFNTNPNDPILAQTKISWAS